MFLHSHDKYNIHLDHIPKLGDKKVCEFLAKIAEGFSRNKLIGYFLILWGFTFLFSALSSVLWIGDGYASAANVVVDGLWSLADIGCAGLLVLLGIKFLHNQE